MIMDEEEKLLETLINVFDDLESFLVHKNHQHIIFAFLQLKKLLRKGSESSKMSTDRKNIEAVSEKNYSKIKRCISGESGNKSLGKESNASFDIIKGAEFFNESRKNKPRYEKQYSEVTKSERPYMENQREEPTRFTGPYKSKSNKVQHPKTNRAQVIPRIVGLVSEEEISDIERKSRRSFQYRGTERSNGFGMDYKSIMEVEDDDDEFEDVVLNRLDKIEEKVNQMLKDKRKQKLQGGNVNIPAERPPLDYYPPNYPTRSRLQSVNSGANINHPHHLQVERTSQYYQYQEPTYKYSSQQMAPGANMLYTFKNTNNNNYLAPNNRMSESFGKKGQFTERARKLSERILSQLPVYANGNEHNAEGYQQPYRPSGTRVREAETFIALPEAYQEENIMRNNKLSGHHYIDSTGTLRYSIEKSQRERPPYSRDQQIHEKEWDSSKSREEVFIDGDHVYKYIPMAKYAPDKTERHFITKRVERSGEAETCDEGQYRVGKVVFIDKVGGEIIRRGRNGDISSKVPDDFYNKSGKSISIIERPLGNSKVKAYTDQGDFISRPDEFSVTSDGGIRSEIREIRETIKHYGSKQVDKRENYKTRNANKGIVQKDVPTNDYRYRQEIEKKHLTSQRSSNKTGRNHEEESFVERIPKEERVINVVREARESHQYVEKRVGSRNSDIQGESKEQRYEEFSPAEDEAVYRSRTSNSSSIKSESANFDRGDSHMYERTQSSQVAQRKLRTNEFRTIIRKDDHESENKISGESVHTFKSIPFNRLQSRKNTLEQMLEKSNHCEKISEQQSYFQDEEEDQEEI